MTVITLSTVGYLLVEPLGPGGEAFTMIVLFVGLGAVFVVLGTLTEIVVSGDLADYSRGVRVNRKIDRLNDHHVVCAYGRVGRAAVRQFREAGEDVVVLDTDERLRPLMERDGLIHLLADPSEEDVLRRAGIDRAKGLVCAVDSDATNVFIVLTARALQPDLHIVARASRTESVERLFRAGADRVVQPYELSGEHMASLAMHPSVVDFFDLSRIGPGLRVEEIEVTDRSRLIGERVGEATSFSDGALTTLALRRANGSVISLPSAELTLGVGDILVVYGRIEALERLER